MKMNLDFRLILASESPRRREILQNAGFDFEVIKTSFREVFPEELNSREVAPFLAKQKAASLLNVIRENDVVLAADTVVISSDRILGKPQNRLEAIKMLTELSGKAHEVVTGCSLLSKNNQIVFSDTTEVLFRPLKIEEIEYYVDTFAPFDKAGAYGIQEWLGMIGIESIVGSYFNVVGLPIQKVYEMLKSFKP